MYIYCYRGMNMRNLLLFLTLTLFVYAGERYCIEVLSTEDKKAITKEFMDKVGTMSLPHSLKYTKGEYKVFIGDFKTREEAETVLPEVREKINKDALVSAIKEGKKPLELNADAKMQHAILMAQAKMIIKPPVKEKEGSAKEESTAVKPVETSGPEGNSEAVTKESQTEKNPVKKAEKQEDKTKEASQEQFCKPTKKALREEEIAEALSFYKNSSFYKFKN